MPWTLNQDHQPSQPLRGDRVRVANARTNLNLKMLFTPTDKASPFHSLLTRPGPVRQMLVAKLDAYKAGVLEGLSAESKAYLAFVRLALTEAEALAWSTPYPHLFLPVLMEEKLHFARQWTSRQCQLATDALRSRATEPEALRVVRIN